MGSVQGIPSSSLEHSLGVERVLFMLPLNHVGFVDPYKEKDMLFWNA